MSPERAQEIMDEVAARDGVEHWGYKQRIRAILAACAEAEREAYTRAAEACMNIDYDPDGVGLTCAQVIEALRDKEEP